MRQKEYERSRAIHTVPTALRQVSKILLTLNLKPHLHKQFFLDKFTCQFLLLA